MITKNRKFEIDTVLNGHEAIIKVRAREEVNLVEIVEAIFSDGLNLKFFFAPSDSEKTVKIEFTSVRGETRKFKSKGIWIDPIMELLKDIAYQYLV